MFLNSMMILLIRKQTSSILIIQHKKANPENTDVIFYIQMLTFSLFTYI